MDKIFEKKNKPLKPDDYKRGTTDVSPLPQTLLTLFTDNYAAIVAPQAIKQATGFYTDPFYSCVDQATSHTMSHYQKNDPAMRSLSVDLFDILALSQTPKQDKLKNIVQEENDWERFYMLYNSFTILTKNSLKDAGWVSDGFFKLPPNPGTTHYPRPREDGLESWQPTNKKWLQFS